MVNEASDVAKETADMVLLDNNFGTILMAVAEGRLMRNNLKKVLLYLMADSFGEITIIVMSLLFRVPLAITAGMILWINLVSDGFPSLALTVEPAEANLLLRKADKRKNWLIDGEMSLLIGLISLVSAGTAFAAFLYYWHQPGYGLDHARSVAFSLLGLNSLVYV
ncbi:cation transporting ATPase C-terminal domain-containing protein, partial [Patescibacteria group bacterium]|nr:cation transporting ATPase C-terminal domain-containing protein [Patescibacteria group bacterium]